MKNLDRIRPICLGILYTCAFMMLKFDPYAILAYILAIACVTEIILAKITDTEINMLNILLTILGIPMMFGFIWLVNFVVYNLTVIYGIIRFPVIK